MQIEIRTRNGVLLTEELRDYARRRFEKVSKQVSEFARLELELSTERNPAIAEQFVVDAVFYLKGATLRASEHSFEMKHAIHEVSDELGRQVERHREKRSHRREAHRSGGGKFIMPPEPLGGWQPEGAQL
ncbi:MAG: ribosome-associated translation inhibitor RaiA [Actinobacteria bacterium]|nr:ribosome-associated translation inhibitor RaiA [Actinomycetota bacterium]